MGGDGGGWCSVGGDGAVMQCGCDGAGSKDTCHSEYPEVATPPDFVLTQQEWQQHE